MRWNNQKIQPDTEALRTSTRMGTFHSVGRRNERILKPSTTSPRFTWINTQSGHKKRKPTTIATNIEELFQLNGLRGELDDKSRATEAFRSMTLQQRIQESKTWSSWAEGLTAVISTTLNRHMRPRRITHPDSFTLSVDLSGKMAVGQDQGVATSWWFATHSQ